MNAPLSRATVTRALLAARSAGQIQGAFYGMVRPFKTGRYYYPHWLHPNFNTTVTLTASRLYRTLFYVDRTTTFAGAFCVNGNTAASGFKLRIGVWDAFSGVLQKDFGEITLTGAAVLNTSAASVTLGPGVYDIGLVCDSAAVMYCLVNVDSNSSGVGIPVPLTPYGRFPAIGTVKGGTISVATIVGEYAAFTYGALPDPITAATVSVFDTGTFPMFGMYV